MGPWVEKSVGGLEGLIPRHACQDVEIASTLPHVAAKYNLQSESTSYPSYYHTLPHFV